MLMYNLFRCIDY